MRILAQKGLKIGKTFLAINSSSRILTSLYASKIPEMPPVATSISTYLSPYHVSKPLDFMILFNRSHYAMSTGEQALKGPWPDMKTIHVVQKGRDHVPGLIW